MRISVETITPAMAREMLGNLGQNTRSLRSTNINMFAKDMAEGRWKLNGQTITLGSNGEVLDGKHRLLACIMSGRSFETLLVRNIDPRNAGTIDSGAIRTKRDVLRMANGTCSSAESSLLSAIMWWLYISYSNPNMLHTLSGTAGTMIKFSHADFIYFSNMFRDTMVYPDIQKKVGKFSGGTVLNMFCHWYFANFGDMESLKLFKEYVSKLEKGDWIGPDHIVYWIREQLLSETPTRPMTKEKITRLYIFGLSEFLDAPDKIYPRGKPARLFGLWIDKDPDIRKFNELFYFPAAEAFYREWHREARERGFTKSAQHKVRMDALVSELNRSNNAV
jgi:hypothetical protein